jgi:hypothetical protein
MLNNIHMLCNARVGNLPEKINIFRPTLWKYILLNPFLTASLKETLIQFWCCRGNDMSLVFCDVSPYSLLGRYQCFGEICVFLPQIWRSEHQGNRILWDLAVCLPTMWRHIQNTLMNMYL